MEIPTKKRVWQQRDPNTIKLEGKEKKLTELVYQTVAMIERGFNLSIEEAASYMGCSYLYALKTLKPSVKHFNINDTVRFEIWKNKEKYDYPDALIALFNKRILLDRSGFQTFLANELKQEIRYKHISIDAFIQHSSYSKLEELLDDEPVLQVLSKASLLLFRKLYAERAKITTAPSLPEKLHSLKEIQDLYGYNHKAQVYTFLSSNGINKYLFRNLVRYDLKDVKASRTTVPVPVGLLRDDCITAIIEHGIVMLLMKKTARAAKLLLRK